MDSLGISLAEHFKSDFALAAEQFISTVVMSSQRTTLKEDSGRIKVSLKGKMLISCIYPKEWEKFEYIPLGKHKEYRSFSVLRHQKGEPIEWEEFKDIGKYSPTLNILVALTVDGIADSPEAKELLELFWNQLVPVLMGN